MTAESMHSARAGAPPRACRSRARTCTARGLPVLLAASALAVAACSHDDRATLSPTAADARASSAPLAQAITAPTATIAILASPAKPLKQAGADLSAAAAPLAPPVIHTVD